MTKVTLINFGDAIRGFYNVDRRVKSVDVGGILDIEMTDTAIARVKRDDTIAIMDPDIAERSHSGLMQTLLDTLRDWASLAMEERQIRTEMVVGVGTLGIRPTNYEMRFAMAKRAKEAAYYLQIGAEDTADNLLGKNLPTLEEQRAKLAKLQNKSDDRGYVKGDDEDANDRRDEGDKRGSGTSDRPRADRLVPSTEGPGVTVPSDDEPRDDRPVQRKPQRQQRLRREPPPKVQPRRVKPAARTTR